MNPNPIHRVLSTLRSHNVRYLLMGGQACVFYGGAEFSRDADIAVLADEETLQRLSSALHELDAECIAVPRLSLDVLRRGHSVHFRCRHPDVTGIRIDVMSTMRGVDPFPVLWKRRTTIDIEGEALIDLMALPDLIAAKKTRRDKDWPMIRRLVESHITQYGEESSPQQVDFWFRECRTPELLMELVRRHRACAVVCKRPAVQAAVAGDERKIVAALADEEAAERAADDVYWRPLIRELEILRHDRLRSQGRVLDNGPQN